MLLHLNLIPLQDFFASVFGRQASELCAKILYGTLKEKAGF